MPVQRPRARDDLQILRRTARGDTVYVIGDVVTGTHSELDEMQHLVLSLLDGRRTIADITEVLVEEHELEVTEEELGQFIDNLQEMSLLDISTDLRLDSRDPQPILRRLRSHLDADGVCYVSRSADIVLGTRDAVATRHAAAERRRPAHHDVSSLIDVALRDLARGQVRRAAAALRDALDREPKN